MSLGGRIGLIIAFAGAIVFALYAGIQRNYILPGILRTEQQEAHESVDRCVNSLQREVYHLESLTRDWAAWDDTYRYVIEPNPEYEEANLAITSFTDNNVCALYIISNAGTVVWGQAYDLAAEEPQSIELFPPYQWAMNSPLMRSPLTGTTVSGLFMTERGPLLVSAQPILTTMKEGPVRGVFVMGRPLDARMVEELEQDTLLPTDAIPVHDARLSETDREALAALEAGAGHFVRPVNDQVLHSYALFSDVSNKPGILLRVEVKRDVLQVGRAAMYSALQALGVSAALVVLLLTVLLRRAVARPLAVMTAHVTRQGGADRLELLPPSGRSDEIGTLEREFNRLVRRLQQENAVRREAEAAVVEREARIRAIVDHVPDGILTINAPGMVESANPAAEHMFGYPCGDLTGLTLECLLTPAPGPESGTVEPQDAPARSSMIAGEGKRKDGGRFPVHVTASDIFFEESGLYAVVVRDVTALHDMQARVVRNEQLAAIGEMGASMAHELRNPLAAISGAIQVMRGGLAADDPHAPVMGEVLEQVTRVDGIVQRLLTLSKPWNPAKHPCDLRALAEKVSCEARKRGLMPETRFEFEPQADPGALIVQADAGLVEQIYWNLVGNAADALRDVPADNSEIHWRFARRDGQVFVSLEDTGPGMPPEVLENLFHPFYTTKTYGTGLGLLICRRIMEAHGGSMEVTSAPGQGTRVTLVFAEGSD